jgi:hypothetical protein
MNAAATTAQTPSPSSPSERLPTPAATECYEVARAAADTGVGPILVNRCNGRTWLLVRVPLDKTEKSFTYHWLPLGIENTEPVLHFGP